MELPEQAVPALLSDASAARTHALDAVSRAANGDFVAAGQLLDRCAADLARAHEAQDALLQQHSRGDAALSLPLVHALDQLTNAAVTHTLAGELIELHQRVAQLSGEL